MKAFLIRLLLFVLFTLLFVYVVKPAHIEPVLLGFICAWIFEPLIMQKTGNG